MESYKILQPRIIYEILTAEVIAIDFNTGTYYALLHSAKEVWLLIEKGANIDQIAQCLTDHYGEEFDRVLTDVRTFIDQLLDNGLIEVSLESNSSDPIDLGAGEWEYTPPKLLSYLDVQDLLLLDPIHKVAEVGWPDKL